MGVVSPALVMLMTPGLALFYGGLPGVRTCWPRSLELHHARRDQYSVAIIGYTLAFRPDRKGLISNSIPPS